MVGLWVRGEWIWEEESFLFDSLGNRYYYVSLCSSLDVYVSASAFFPASDAKMSLQFHVYLLLKGLLDGGIEKRRRRKIEENAIGTFLMWAYVQTA